MTTDATSVADRLRAEFCPPLDSSLLSALLLDFPDPPSTEDEWLLRATLKSLAADVETEERLEQGELADGEQSRSVSDVLSSPSAGLEGEGSRGTTGTEERSVSELGSALDVWDLADGEGERKDGGRRFWMGSRLSTTTSEEEPAAASPTYAPKQPQQEVPDDPLAFLANVFPDLSLETLEARLSSGLNLESIVDELLSQAFITSLNTSESDSPAPIAASSPKGNTDKQARRRAKAAVKASTTLSLTSTPHLTSSPSLASATLPFADPSTPAITQALPTSNRWASLSSHSSNISSLLHIDPSRFTSTYHSCSSSLPLTLSTLLNSLSTSRPCADLPNSDMLKAQLSTVLPGVKADRLEVLLSATEGDLADAMDLQAAIIELERTEGKMTWSELIEVDPLASGANTKGVSTSSTPSSTIAALPTALSTPETYSSADCYHYEAEFTKRRNEAIRSAARHFQRGGTAQRGAAYYWAEEGRVLDGKRRIWSERAAKAVVRERRIHNQNTIDLHGLTLHHAQTVVRESCNAWWAASSSPSPPPLRIITGLGRHSTNNNPVLLPAVTKLLDREGWRWKYDQSHGGGESRGAVLVVGMSR